MSRISIVSASVAAGHDGAARELARRLRAAGHTVDCHDFVELVPGGWGRRLRAAYRRQLDLAPGSWDWLLRVLQRRPVLTALIGWLAGASRRRLLAALHPASAVVVSTYPLATQALCRLRRSGRLNARLVAYLTDPSVHRLAVGRECALHLAMHEVTAGQARKLGAPGVAVTAPAVRPQFRPARSPADRVRARVAFGLPRTGALVLLLSGSWGIGEVEHSARDVLATGAGKPVVVCGHNDVLRRRLIANLPLAVVLGWVDNMAELMRACDVVVQNAGGLGALEAWATGLPVLTYRCLAGHGRTNAMVWRDAGLAPWPADRHQLGTALFRALSSTAPPEQRLTGLDPAAVITAIAGQRAAVPARSRTTLPFPRRVATGAMAMVALAWLGTEGPTVALAHGWRTAPVAPRGEVSVIAAPAPGRGISAAQVASLRRMRAAVALSADMVSSTEPLRTIRASRLTIVNGGVGAPYETGEFTGRFAIGTVARAVHATGVAEPELLLSNGDVDLLDIATASAYHERIVVPRVVLSCEPHTGPLPTSGVLLVRATPHCALGTALSRLAARLAAQSLRVSTMEGTRT